MARNPKAARWLGKSVGKRFLLTAAVPSGNVSNQHFELKPLSGVLDWMRLMTDHHRREACRPGRPSLPSPDGG